MALIPLPMMRRRFYGQKQADVELPVSLFRIPIISGVLLQRGRVTKRLWSNAKNNFRMACAAEGIEEIAGYPHHASGIIASHRTMRSFVEGALGG
jgi:hypothetical protein